MLIIDVYAYHRGIQHAHVVRLDGSGSVTITKFVYTEVLCWHDITHVVWHNKVSGTRDKFRYKQKKKRSEHCCS